MFANTLMPGLNFAMPDVCLTPAPPAPVPIPIPYPNFSLTLGVPFAPVVFFAPLPALNLASTVPFSWGDLPGIAGVASGVVMGPTRWIIGSPTVLVCGLPAVRWLVDPTLQNLTNCPGIGRTIVPSQVKVLVLS